MRYLEFLFSHKAHTWLCLANHVCQARLFFPPRIQALRPNMHRLSTMYSTYAHTSASISRHVPNSLPPTFVSAARTTYGERPEYNRDMELADSRNGKKKKEKKEKKRKSPRIVHFFSSCRNPASTPASQALIFRPTKPVWM